MNVANQSNEGIKPPFSVTLEEDDYDYQQAIQRTAGWVGAAITFGAVLWAVAGSNVGEEFFAGYLVEQSLSVDNLFVFLVLFEYFKVPLNLQDRVLNWGIYGAIVMRAFMIGLGAAALQQFHAILLVFAAILIYGSVSFFLGAGKDEDEDDLSQNTIVKFSSSLINSTDRFDGKKFFTMEDGVRKATPLFICMIAVEISDIVFAVDSIPAVFGVTDVSLWGEDQSVLMEAWKNRKGQIPPVTKGDSQEWDALLVVTIPHFCEKGVTASIRSHALPFPLQSYALVAYAEPARCFFLESFRYHGFT